MSINHRRTIFTADARFRVTTQAGQTTLRGYAMVWNVPSTDRGGFKIRLLPGSATFANPTHALFHHDFRLVIGTTANGSLRISPDDYGVRVEIDMPNTMAGRDTAELVQKKYVRGMSFAMVDSPRGATRTEAGETILDAEAFTVDEVTITPIPAFTDAAIAVKLGEGEGFSGSTRAAHAIRLARFRLEQLRT